MAGKPEKGELSPEKYFLRYAYPCSFVLVDLGKISDDKRKELEKKLLSNELVGREELENIFLAAFKRLKQIAGEMKKDYWSIDVIKEYFFDEKHNDFIDQRDGMYARITPTIRDLCKVHKADVLERKDNVLTIKYNDTIRKVFATLVPDAKKGDRVTVHWAFAIEKID